MSQTVFSSINPAVTSGTQLAQILNDFKNAVMSGLVGATRPTETTAGGIWVSNADNPIWRVFIFDGTVDIELLSINTTTGISSISNTDTQFEIVKISADELGPILKLRKSRIADAGQVKIDDEIGVLEFFGNDNASNQVNQASIIVKSLDDVTSVAQGSYIAIELINQGSNTKSEKYRFVDGKFGVGKVTVLEAIHAEGSARLDKESDDANGPYVILRKKRISGGGQVLTNDEIGAVKAISTDDLGAEVEGASIKVMATENHTTAARGNKISISTTDLLSNTQSEKIEISEIVEPKVHTKAPSMEVTNEYYLGDRDTNGSWRFKVVGGNLEIQVRIAGVWTTKDSIGA